MENEREFICIDEPIEKIASDIVENIKERAWDNLEEVWEDGITDTWIEREIKEYAENKWGKDIHDSLFEAIWNAIDWKKLEDVETEAREIEKEWEKEQKMFWATGMRESDFL